MNALNAYNRLNANVTGMKKASEKLSSGYRINRAGDDAAGLAVSEKMRSQIRGLNQAIRNSQDGINMIQTFEGAAQETHSILQRMKELATESANGTYDNATDRAAMELEFKQLNDELDQIADTDFNGTIVLNGGQMSDGMYALKDGALLKSDDGSEYITGAEFDYVNGNKLLEAENSAAGVDVTSRDTDPAHDILANNVYNKEMADQVWDALGLSTDDATQVSITFKKNGQTWEAVAVTKGVPGQAATEDTPIPGTPAKADTIAYTDGGGNNGSAVFDDDGSTAAAKCKAAGLAEGTITATKTAGKWAVADKDGKALTLATDTDLSDLGITVAGGNGDTVTFKYTAEVADSVQAGTAAVESGEVDITADVDLSKIKGTQAGDGSDVDTEDLNGDGGLTLTIGDATMEAVFNANDAADGDYVTFTFTNSNEVSLAPTKAEYREDTFVSSLDDVDTTKGLIKKSDMDIKFTLDAGLTKDAMTETAVTALDALNAATFTMDEAGALTTDEADFTIENDGTVVYKKGDADELTLGVLEATLTKSDKLTAAEGDGTVTAYTVDFGIKTAQYKYADADVEAHNIETTDALKTAMAGKQERPLSESNAFNKSEARLTYSNNITLQTGARSKDAVRFTFAYNQDDSVDMRGLEANLNLSSRADGLNTANLSLANQEDANHAIDQIDKAINKTSMVRATFGAIQNRLEHKITNLTTTSENLTEAESAIRDTDMASEMMNYTKFNILQQAAQSMLAQANQQPQSILQLLG